MPCTKVVLGVTADSLCRPAILLPSFLFGWYGCFLLATTTAVSNHHWENRQPRPTVNRRSQRWAAASFRQQHQQLIQQTLSISAIYLCLYRPAFSFIFSLLFPFFFLSSPFHSSSAVHSRPSSFSLPATHTHTHTTKRAPTRSTSCASCWASLQRKFFLILHSCCCLSAAFTILLHFKADQCIHLSEIGGCKRGKIFLFSFCAGYHNWEKSQF